MNLLFWGLTTGLIGKILLVVAILKAHGQISHEHKIDAKVLETFRIEKWITILGLIFIITGYCMEVYFYGVDTPLLTCKDQACEEAAAILSQ